jgi:protoporphyrinogen oxidase
MPLRVAIVGSGVSGLAALWALNQSAENEVHIFEAQDYTGGHVQTVYWQTQRGDKKEAYLWIWHFLFSMKQHIVSVCF